MAMIMNQVKDVRVPAQLMRAMAAEAEAAREARAKVVLFNKMMMVMKVIMMTRREARAKVVLFMTIHSWGPKKSD